MRKSEETLHITCAKILAAWAKPNVAWWHTPNGESRDERTGRKLKAMGVKPGVPDFCILHEAETHFIELKTETGRMSKSQNEFREWAASAGVSSYHLARNVDEFVSACKAIGILRVPITVSPNRAEVMP